MKAWVRRLRGFIGNSLVWGVAWFAGATAVLGTLLLTGVFSTSHWSWEIVFERARDIGFVGLGAGAVFSVSLPFLFRGRTLDQVDATRFVLGGAALAGLTLLGGVELMVRGSIYPSPFFFAGVASVFGAVTAAVSLGAAKHAQRLDVRTSLESLEAMQEETRGVLQAEAG